MIAGGAGGVRLDADIGHRGAVSFRPVSAIPWILLSATELDPAVFVLFEADNLNRAVAFANANNIAFPAWFAPAIAYPLSCEQFKATVMDYVALQTRGTVQAGSFVAPNDMVEALRVTGCITMLNSDAYIQALATHAGGYLAQVFLVRESNRSVTGVPAGIFNNLFAGLIAAFI